MYGVDLTVWQQVIWLLQAVARPQAALRAGWALGRMKVLRHAVPGLTTVRMFVPALGMAAALTLVLSGALGATAAEGFPRTLVDELGQAIVLEQPPQRIFSVGLAMDNILLSITDPARVVAVTRFALDPASSYVIDRIQDHMIIVDQLNAEQVLAAHPDIVLITEWNNPDVVRQLRDLGVTLYTFTGFDTVEDALDMVLRIGEITGDEERAAAIVAEFRQRAAAVAERVAGRERPRVLVLDNWGGTTGPGLSAHDIIELAGGINLAAEYGIQGWQPIDREAVVEMNPDVIITYSGEAFAEELRRDPVLQAVKAGRTGQIFHVNHMEIHTHHYILAIEELARRLHPEAFSQ